MSNQAFTQLVDAHYTPLYRFALSLARREADACNLVQQTFYIWATKGDSLREETKAKSWLFTTLYREFLRGRRRDARATSIERNLPPGDQDIAAEEVDCVAKMDAAGVVAALQTVDEVFRAPLTLFYLEDLSYLEIAEALDVPIGTVMSRLSRGKAQMRASLAREESRSASLTASATKSKIISFPGAQRGEVRMNNTEAKFILNAYRPNGRDATDATFRAALDQAKSDPELGAWFAREQAHGAAVAAKLREITPPAGLREALLAGGRVSGGKFSAQPTTLRSFWNRPVWLAAAAAVALLLVVGASVWPKRAAANGALTDYALSDALEPQTHGGHGEMTGAFQASLSKDNARLADGVPLDFAALKNNGCRTVNVAGHDVLEVCFKRNGTWFHCYVARVEDFPGAPAKFAPAFAQSGKVAAAAWSDGAHRFVVASVAGRAALQRLL